MWTISAPGARTRPDHRVPSGAEQAAARAEVERRARELVASGALDRGNGDVLEPYLGALLAQWRARLAACGGDCAASGPPALRVVPAAPEAGPVPARSGAGLKVLLAAAFAGDIANFYLALSAVGNASPVATLFVVVALTAAALGLAHGAGRAVRAERTPGYGPDRPGRPAIVVLTGLWLAIGLTAATVRLLSPTSATAGSFGAAPVQAGPDPANLALTGLFLALYLASGAMAAVVGLAGDPGAGQHRREHRREHRVRRRERDGRARAGRLAAGHAAAGQRCAAVVDELRSHAMHVVQCELGEPGVTSATTWRPARAAG